MKANYFETILGFITILISFIFLFKLISVNSNDSSEKYYDLNAKFFEISEEDFSNENPLFEYFSISWVITGRKDEVERENKKTLATLPNSLQKLLFPLQLWRPTKNSRDDVEKKLERLVR